MVSFRTPDIHLIEAPTRKQVPAISSPQMSCTSAVSMVSAAKVQGMGGFREGEALLAKQGSSLLKITICHG